MIRTVLILAILLVPISCQQNASCECQNGGSCFLINQTMKVCNCTDHFLDKHCSKSSQEINQTKQTFNINSQYSYFFTDLNYSTIYLIQIYFCPIQFEKNSRFQIYIEFEKEDNSLVENIAEKKVQTFLAVPHQCLLFRSPISNPYLKIDGEPPKLVTRIRNVGPASPNIKQTSQKWDHFEATVQNISLLSTMTITAYRYPIYDLESLHIGDYLVIFSVTILFLTSIAFFILRRSLRRRINVYQYRAAQPAHSISHFDTVMPSVYHPKENPSASESEQHMESECMICLLGIVETETRTTPCGHLFHKECIDQWGRKNLTCPACRNSLRDSNQVQMIDIYQNI